MARHYKISTFIAAILFSLLFIMPLFAVNANADYICSTPVISEVVNSIEGISVSWGAVEGAETYTVLRKTEKSGSWVKMTVTADTSWTDTTPKSGRTYYYAVRCSNKDGTEYTSSRDSKGTEIFCIRSRNIDVENSVDGVRLSWNEITNISSYEVYRRLPGETEWTLLAQTEADSITDGNVKSGETYEYTVCGKKYIGNKYVYGALDPAKVKSIRFLAAPVITQVSQSNANIVVSWETVEGAEAYTILKKTNDGKWTKKSTVTGTSWIDTAEKKNGNTYIYAVRCSDKKGKNYTSARYDGTAYVYLDIPLIESIEIKDDGAELAISMAKCTKKYEIHRIENGEDTVLKTIKNKKEKETVTYTDTTAVNGTEYTYYVTAIYDDTRVNSAETRILFINKSEARYVNETFINLYQKPDAASTSVRVPYKDEIQYIETTYEDNAGSWQKVGWNDGIYYMWNDAGKNSLTAEKPSYTAENSLAQAVIDKALDIHYSKNAVFKSDPEDSRSENEYTSSGFVAFVQKRALKRQIPVLDYEERADKMFEMKILFNQGLTGEYTIPDVKQEDIKAGDFIFFRLPEETGDKTDNEQSPTHVGIYLGNNEFIYCTQYSWGDGGTYVMPLNEYYQAAVIGIKRFIPETAIPANKTMYLAAHYVNLRNGFGPYSSILDTGYGNSEVTVLYTGSRWAFIELNRRVFFVDKGYLSEASANETFTEKSVKASQMILYKEPSTGCPAKVTVQKDEKLSYGGKYYNSNFYVIKYKDDLWYYYYDGDINEILE